MIEWKVSAPSYFGREPNTGWYKIKFFKKSPTWKCIYLSFGLWDETIPNIFAGLLMPLWTKTFRSKQNSDICLLHYLLHSSLCLRANIFSLCLILTMWRALWNSFSSNISKNRALMISLTWCLLADLTVTKPMHCHCSEI